MERSSKRGKIPQNDWPSIIARYEAGETLASIARTYDCSAPAISYIVSRSRARDAAAETAAPPEPELVKGRTVDTPSSDLRQTAPPDGGTRAGEISSEPHIERVPGEASRIEPRL